MFLGRKGCNRFGCLSIRVKGDRRKESVNQGGGGGDSRVGTWGKGRRDGDYAQKRQGGLAGGKKKSWKKKIFGGGGGGQYHSPRVSGCNRAKRQECREILGLPLTYKGRETHWISVRCEGGAEKRTEG